MANMIITFELRLPVNLKEQIRALRRLFVLEALKVSEGDRLKAAKLLGLERRTLLDYIEDCERQFEKICHARQ